MENKPDENPEKQPEKDSTPVPRAGIPRTASKMDWMDLPFRQVRGLELHSEETERFYHTLS